MEWSFEGVELPTLKPKALGPFSARSAFLEYDPGTKFSEEHNMLGTRARQSEGCEKDNEKDPYLNDNTASIIE